MATDDILKGDVPATRRAKERRLGATAIDYGVPIQEAKIVGTPAEPVRIQGTPAPQPAPAGGQQVGSPVDTLGGVPLSDIARLTNPYAPVVRGGGATRQVTIPGPYIEKGLTYGEDEAKVMEARKKAEEAALDLAIAEEEIQLKAARAQQAAVQERQRVIDEGEQFLAEREQIQKERAVAVQTQINKIDSAIADFNEGRIEDYWAKKGTGSKITAAIAMAMGTFAQGLTGVPNTALAVINKAIDDDYQRQKDNINLKRVKIENMKGALARTYQMYDDELLQKDAAYNLMWEQVKAKAKHMQAMAQSQEQVDRAGMVVQTAEAQQEQLRLNMIDRMATKEYQRSEQVKTVRTGPPGTAPAGAEQLREMLGIEKYDRKLYVKRGGGNASNQEEKKQAENVYDRIDKVKYSLDELDRLWDKHGREWLFGAGKTEALAIANDIATDLAVMKNLGAISESDKQIVYGMLGGEDPAEVFFNYAVTARGALRRSMGRSEILIQQRLHPVLKEHQPKAFQGIQRHDWSKVYPAFKKGTQQGGTQAPQVTKGAVTGQ